MKNFILLSLLISFVSADYWISKNDHKNSKKFVPYCYKGQTYFVYNLGFENGLITPAIYKGEFIRCKVLKTNFNFFKDSNEIEYYIIKNNKKIIVQLD